MIKYIAAATFILFLALMPIAAAPAYSATPTPTPIATTEYGNLKPVPTAWTLHATRLPLNGAGEVLVDNIINTYRAINSNGVLSFVWFLAFSIFILVMLSAMVRRAQED